MEQNTQEGNKKGLDFVRAVGAIFYLLNLYWFSAPLLFRILPSRFVEYTYGFLQLVNERLLLFRHPYLTFALALLFIGLYGWAERGKKEERAQLTPLLRPVCSLLEYGGVVDRGEEGRIEEENDNGKVVTKIRLVRVEGWCIVALGVLLVLLSPAALKIRIPLLMAMLYILLSGMGILYFVLGCNYIHKVSRSFGVTDPYTAIVGL